MASKQLRRRAKKRYGRSFGWRAEQDRNRNTTVAVRLGVIPSRVEWPPLVSPGHYHARYVDSSNAKIR